MTGRSTGKIRLLTLFPFFFEKKNPYDEIKTEEDDVLESLTGFQRLRKLFESTQDNAFNPALVQIGQTSLISLLIGGIYGGSVKSRYAFIDFIEKNEATQFLSHHDAKKRLSDRMFVSYYQGFAKYGVKVSIFCTTLITTYTILSVYNNNDSVLYYSTAGAVSGALYKFPLGPKGMVSGAVFGCFFGSVYGSIKWIMSKITSLTEEQMRKTGVEMKSVREEAKIKAMRGWQKAREEKEMVQAMKDS